MNFYPSKIACVFATSLLTWKYILSLEQCGSLSSLIAIHKRFTFRIKNDISVRKIANIPIRLFIHVKVTTYKYKMIFYTFHFLINFETLVYCT